MEIWRESGGVELVASFWIGFVVVGGLKVGEGGIVARGGRFPRLLISQPCQDLLAPSSIINIWIGSEGIKTTIVVMPVIKLQSMKASQDES